MLTTHSATQNGTMYAGSSPMSRSRRPASAMPIHRPISVSPVISHCIHASTPPVTDCGRTTIMAKTPPAASTPIPSAATTERHR